MVLSCSGLILIFLASIAVNLQIRSTEVNARKLRTTFVLQEVVFIEKKHV